MVLLAFTLQAIVPVGFMPAAVSTGQVIQLCPSGMAPELMSIFHPQHQLSDTAHPHHNHHQPQPKHEQMQHEQWRADCPFGVVAFSDLLAPAWPGSPRLADAGSATLPLYAEQLFVHPALSTQQARAPPSATS